MKVEWKKIDTNFFVCEIARNFQLRVHAITGSSWKWDSYYQWHGIDSGILRSRTAAQRAAERALTKLIEDAVKAKEIAG